MRDYRIYEAKGDLTKKWYVYVVENTKITKKYYQDFNKIQNKKKRLEALELFVNKLKDPVYEFQELLNLHKERMKPKGFGFYNYFLNKFPNIKFHRHTNFVPPEFEWGSVGPSIKDEYGKMNSGDIIELRAFSEYILFKHDIKMWYSAVNKNPTDVNDGPAERNISEITLEQLIKEKENDLYLCKPFLFLEKDWIINAYKKLKILDLFEITRSCEGDKNTAPEIFNNLDYTNYDWGMYVPECNSCFWCKERQWGLKYGK
jgi:hypothetical protein